jgi:hypothetical protein
MQKDAKPFNPKSGDMIFFGSRPGDLIGTMICVAQRYFVMHVGMVFEMDGVPLLFECGRVYHDDLIDCLTYTYRKTGVRLVDLTSRLSQETGKIYWRSCRREMSVEQLKTARRFVSKMRSRDYEHSLWDMFNSVFRVCIPKDNDFSTLFCSELISETCMRIGWLNREYAASYYSPAHLASNMCDRFHKLKHILR